MRSFEMSTVLAILRTVNQSDNTRLWSFVTCFPPSFVVAVISWQWLIINSKSYKKIYKTPNTGTLTIRQHYKSQICNNTGYHLFTYLSLLLFIYLNCKCTKILFISNAICTNTNYLHYAIILRLNIYEFTNKPLHSILALWLFKSHFVFHLLN